MGQRRASERQRTRREADRQTEQALGTMSRPQCKPSKSIKARMDPPPTFPPRCCQGFKVGASVVPVCPCSPSPEPHVGLRQRDLFLTTPHLRLCAQGPEVIPRGQPEGVGGAQPGKQALLTQDPTQQWEGDQTVTRIKGCANREWATWILGGDPGDLWTGLS